LNSDDILNRGRNAENLLNNTTLSEAFEEMLSEVSRSWLATKPMEYDERTELYLRAQAIQALRGTLMGWLGSAQIEAAKLQKQSRKSR